MIITDSVTLHCRDGFASTLTNYTLRGLVIPDRFSEATTIRIVQEVVGATPRIGDEITARGVRYYVLAVNIDSAKATCDCLCRQAAIWT